MFDWFSSIYAVNPHMLSVKGSATTTSPSLQNPALPCVFAHLLCEHNAATLQYPTSQRVAGSPSPEPRFACAMKQTCASKYGSKFLVEVRLLLPLFAKPSSGYILNANVCILNSLCTLGRLFVWL